LVRMMAKVSQLCALYITHTNTSFHKDYDDAMLDRIFDRTVAEELKLREDDISAVVEEPNNKLSFYDRCLLFLEKSKDSIREKMQEKTTFYKANNVWYGKPMFDSTWRPLLAAFSLVFEDTDVRYLILPNARLPLTVPYEQDEALIELCMEGMATAVRLSCIFNMDIERQSFITSLYSFTLLDSHKEIKPKHIECIKTLLRIATTNGNYLRDSWRLVRRMSPPYLFSSLTPIIQLIKLVSSLDRLGSISSTHPAQDPSASPARKSLLIEAANAAVVSTSIPSVNLDRMFTDSVGLNNRAILDFVVALCGVSQEELALASPRLFCMRVRNF